MLTLREFAVAMVVALGGAMGATHAESGMPSVSFSGFGSIGAVHSSERQADYTSSVLRPNGAGASRDWSFDPDTRIGLQMTADMTPSLSAVLQVISEQRHDNSYYPTVEWANLHYRVSPDFSVRIGRIALPTFLAADYRKVGYATPWVRPPENVYGLVPITNSDGIDATYRVKAGDWRHTLQASYGRTNVRSAAGVTPEVRNLWGIVDTIERGPLTLRMSCLRGAVNIQETRPLFDGFRAFGPQGQAIADRYDADHKVADLLSAGISYDPGNWFLMAEAGSIDTRSYVGHRTGWYASGGYRFGALTPYFVYSRVRSNGPLSDPGLDTSVLRAPLTAAAAGLNAGLNTALARIAVQNTVSAGIRWDLAKNVAVNLQYDRIGIGAGSQGPLVNPQPGLRPGGTVNVLSFTFDFLF